MDTPLSAKIDAFIAENKDAIVADIAQVVAHRSVEGPGGPGQPYGPGPRAALNAALDIARRLGLATDDGEGYVGWAEVPGREKGYLATITHMDIVPEGDGWDGDPLVLRQRDGWLLGRGVSDDKGPGILCLYAAKFLAQQPGGLRYGLRVLLGCNEETGMTDVAHYLAHNEEPLFCFSPDAKFPVCNGEKGVYEAAFLSPPLAGPIVEFSGGIASNVVPGKAHCVIKTTTRPAATSRVTVSPAGEGQIRLDAKGVGGHAAKPAGTVNAIGLLVDFLLDNQLVPAGADEAFLQLLRRLHSATDGSGLGIACSDERFTPLTCIGGTIALNDGRLRQGINIRYPAATTGQALTTALEAAAGAAGSQFELERDAKPFYISADSAPIAVLLDTYAQVSGQPAEPFTMGGGTYARHFKNAVSFGPAFPGQQLPDFAGPEHAANEGAYLPDMLKALKIYILALARLQEVDF